MVSQNDRLIQGLAETCVDDMGDIFWDHVDGRDGPLGFAEPRSAAVRAVVTALEKFSQTMDASEEYPATLRDEYAALVEGVGEDASDNEMQAVLVTEADWTEHGAREVVRLAREYGTFVLSNALALAAAMGIEDGEKGL